ncbi:MAG: hypothetical protein JXB48_01870 [Candidatus Latescibacteria bacterium]|nr:hypothetical protein [Candidatus Latescibacterota bacterium]
MLQQFLFKILIVVIAIDILFAGIFIVFLINTRLILKNQFSKRRFEIRILLAAQKAASSEDASRQLGITVEEFQKLCLLSKVDTPEERINKKQQAENKKQEELRQILEEEAAWRIEQERIAEERRRQKEEETRKRKERLRKFGIS